jgi:ribosomal RNA-processing protein 1
MATILEQNNNHLHMSSKNFENTKQVEPIEHKICKNLAHNDLTFRKQGFNQLEKYIKDESIRFTSESKSEENKEDDNLDSKLDSNLLKIWKGLFYMLWHSDGLIAQENLCLDISKLITKISLGNKNENLSFFAKYLKAFFVTMSREWQGIDRYRISKYMLLVRFTLREIFCLVQGYLNLADRIFDDFYNSLLSPTSKTSMALTYHLIDIYLDEWKISKYGTDHVEQEVPVTDDIYKAKGKVSQKEMEIFMTPWIKVCLFGKKDSVRENIYEKIFEILLQESQPAIEIVKQTPNRVLSADNKAIILNSPRLNICFTQLITLTKTLISSKHENLTIKQSNRTKIYELIEKFEDISKGQADLKQTPDLS